MCTICLDSMSREIKPKRSVESIRLAGLLKHPRLLQNAILPEQFYYTCADCGEYITANISLKNLHIFCEHCGAKINYSNVKNG